MHNMHVENNNKETAMIVTISAYDLYQTLLLNTEPMHKGKQDTAVFMYLLREKIAGEARYISTDNSEIIGMTTEDVNEIAKIRIRVEISGNRSKKNKIGKINIGISIYDEKDMKILAAMHASHIVRWKKTLLDCIKEATMKELIR